MSARLEFSKAIKLQAWRRARGRCEGEDCPNGGELYGRRPEYDHKKPATMGGDNSLANCVVYCAECHRKKTLIEDMPSIWKSNRVIEKRAGVRRKGRFIPYRLFDGTQIWKRR